MALSKETAKKIIEVVALDPECRKSIESPSPTKATINPVPDLLFNSALRYMNLAGSVRNVPLVLQGIASGKSPEEDPETTSKLCLGIALVTFQAIHKTLSQGKLPEVRKTSTLSRKHWGIHHSATWVRMQDDSEYVFDWHATLSIRGPALSRVDDWVNGKCGTNFVFFRGF